MEEVPVAKAVRKILFHLVLEDAILREESAYRFYESARELAGSEAARHLLKKLCAEELRHRMKLEQMRKDGWSGELEFSGSEEIELLDEKERSWPEITAQSTVIDILEAALAKEKQAARYYQLMASRSSLRPAKDLFRLLAGEEAAHVRWVQKQPA
jgi:rubrerythrin